MRRRTLFAAASLLGWLPALAAAAPKRPEPPHRPPARKPAAPAQPAETATPGNSPIGPVDTVAKWAIAIDYQTGATLFDKNADARMPPSSMTKLMTATIVYGMLASGRLKLDQTLPVSEKAWRMGGSKMFVPLGQQVSVNDLIQGMIVQSGNDACIVLAEGIAGSEDEFVKLMNEKAQQLGLKNTHFMNATGWPDPDHYMSARDIATVARNLISSYPQYYHYDAEKIFTYDNIKQENRNPLVQKGLADGLKTGHTDAGGYGLVASAERGGRRVILVLNGMGTARDRGEEGERLLDWAFRSFENVTLFAAGQTVDQAKVWLGAQPSVALVAAKPLLATLPVGWKDKGQVAVHYQSPIPAPIPAGAVLGSASVAYPGMDTISTNLVAGSAVARMPLPGRALAVVGRWLRGS
jgi:D-alanyl-D-alanine carboxypeptidase (penicillin-binding protein 5/6)